MVANNLPHKIQGKWKVPQIEMYGKAIDMSYFQLFGMTCHVLIQQKGHSKIEAKTHKAIFTGIECNTGSAWRYLALPDRAIRTSQNVFFPHHLPNPTSSNAPQPVHASDSYNSTSSENWIQIFALSEGEMGIEGDKHTHRLTPEHDSTQHEPEIKTKIPKPNISKTKAQGEMPSTSTPPSVTSPPRTVSHNHSEHMHRPAVLASPPSPLQERSIPGQFPPSRHIQTRRQAAAENTPYQHQMLDPKTSKACALWLEALDNLHECANAAIRDPEDVIPINLTHTGTNRDLSTLPPHIVDCFNMVHKTRDDDLPCFFAWIAQNYSVLTRPHDAPNTNTPKWANTLKSNQCDEWIAAISEEFTNLIKQDIFNEIS
ncbi:hypothetical protein OPQ81_003804 [Rhizoctonia solani]|nr:hypothetical protein OPQ81_003804 [Rhizoctonia solani]